MYINCNCRKHTIFFNDCSSCHYALFRYDIDEDLNKINIEQSSRVPCVFLISESLYKTHQFSITYISHVFVYIST